MISSVFDAHATGRALPNLALDFTVASLDDRVTFSRSTSASSPATYVNDSGIIVQATDNQPRFDYDPVTSVSKGLLIEGARTNALFDSGITAFNPVTFNNVWIDNVTQLDTTLNSGVSPDGNANATLLSINIATSFRAIIQRSAVSVGGTYTYSVYAKPTSTDVGLTLLLAGDVSVVNHVAVVFALSGNGSVVAQSSAGTAVSASAPTIKRAGNGWYRCTVQATLTSPTNITCYIYPGNRASQTTNTQTLVWGAQLEAGAFVTSHIPTTSATATRNADVATITGSNFSDLWRAGKGSALVKAQPSTISGVRPVLQFDDATADNIIALRGNAANPELYVRTGGSDQAQIDAGTIAANVRYRLAGAWATDNCAASVNSGTPALDGVATIPVVTQARLGSDGTNYLNGHLEAIEYYDERIPNSALQVVSSTAGYRSIIRPVFRDAIIS
jgi:hypothetical protein